MNDEANNVSNLSQTKDVLSLGMKKKISAKREEKKPLVKIRNKWVLFILIDLRIQSHHITHLLGRIGGVKYR